MQMYNAVVEVARKDIDTDDAMEALAAYHVAMSESERGWVTAQISLPAEDLAQATASACAVVARALGGEPVAAEVMTESEFDAREGFVPVPELLSVGQAAERLGVSRQRVLQMIGEGKLPRRKVGREYVLPAASVGV